MKVEVNTVKKRSQFREYLELLGIKYASHHGFNYYKEDVVKSLDYVLSTPHQLAWQVKITSKNELLAHTLIMADDRLQNNEAVFGFFECVEEECVFNLLWQEVTRVSTTHGFRKLRGPINGTTWHPYRVIKKCDGVDYFPSEPLSEKYYYKYFLNAGKAEETAYYSGLRKNLNMIISTTTSDYHSLTQNGYNFAPAETFDERLLHKIFILSSEIFRKNFGFVNLSMDEFLDLYNTKKLNQYLGNIYLATKEDEVFGFCNTLLDGSRLIIKTIAVLPALQGIGLGNALVHKVHYDARKLGYNEVIYALVRKGNQVKNFPRDDVSIFREYACFDFKIY